MSILFRNGLVLTMDNHHTVLRDADVVVDGLSRGAVASYTFSNVTADHTISASFAQNTTTTALTGLPASSVVMTRRLTLSPGT